MSATAVHETPADARATVVRIIARLNVGGPAQHVILLGNRVAARYRTVLVTGSVGAGEGDMIPAARARGVWLHHLPALRPELSLWHDLKAFVQLLVFLLRARPAIVHTHTAKAGTLGRVAAVLAGVPVRVHTFHGHVFDGYFSARKTRVFLAIERVLSRFTTRIIAISPSQKADLVERYHIAPADRITVLPIGLELERFRNVRASALRAEFRNEIGVSADAPVVTMVGRLVPIKNHGLFLNMVARLRAVQPRATFLIVGDGAERASLVALSHTLGVADRVQFLGWRSDLERVYAGSDLTVLCSTNEGTPVCLIEALAAGCPVVATDVGGVRDVLQHGDFGRLVPANDADALAAAVAEALADSAGSTAQAARGASAMQERYSATRLIADVEKLYDDLMVRAQ